MLKQKKKQIIDVAGELMYHDRMKILKYLKDSKVKICTAGDGSRCDLDKLTTESIEELYKIVNNYKNNIPEINRI
jgi:hypothetical protein